MARAKPVVATAVDGIPEIVHDTESGLLFPHEDHEALASHITGLLQDQPWGRRLGEAGRRLVRTEFSSVQFAAGMNAVYDRMLSSGRDSFAVPAQSLPAQRESV